MAKRPILYTWFLLLILAIIWGSSFFLIKRSLFDSAGNSVFSGDQVAALRLGFTFLFLTPVLIRSKMTVFRKNWKALLGTGLLGNCIPAFLFAFAQTRISSSVAGMINSLTPLFTFIVATLLFGATFKKWNILGLVIGLIGSVLLIVMGQDSSQNSENMLYAVLIVVATIGYAFSTNIIKYLLADVKPIQIVAFAFLIVGPPGIIYLFTTPFMDVLWTNPAALESLLFVGMLSLFGTALALILFNRLVQMTSSVFAASVTYLLPPVALTWGVMDGEQVSVLEIASIAIILGGVYLVNRK